MIKNDLYPHVFQPLKIRGLTLKNRLEYSPTVVLKCSPEGEVTQEMLDYVAWQADTGVGYLTIGNTPVVHSDSSAWTCELNVTSDRCIHGLEMMVRTAREHGAEMSVELAHAGRGSSHDPKIPALAPSDVPLNGGPLGYIKPMNREDMDFIKKQFVDCAVRCQKAGLRIIMIHCAHNNLLAQFISPASNHRTDEYGGSLENRMRYPLEVLKAVREAVPGMVIECRVSAQEDTPDGLQLEESLQFMEKAQEFVDIIHVSRGNIFFNYGSTWPLPPRRRSACTSPSPSSATSPPWLRPRRSSPAAKPISWSWRRRTWRTITSSTSPSAVTPTMSVPAPAATGAATPIPTVPPCAAPSTPCWASIST